MRAMNKLILASILVAAVLPVPARPQVAFQMHVNLGTPLPPQPPLVVVQPGVQVVENYDEEVFFSGGFYWVRRGDLWYRAPGPRATFVYVPVRRVPPVLVSLPPGHYRHYGREQGRAEYRAWKERDKAERREAKEREKEARREHHERHDEHHGHGQH